MLTFLRFIGFEKMGNNDNFKTEALENILLRSGKPNCLYKLTKTNSFNRLINPLKIKAQ